MKENYFITIGRQFGSGGHTIGKLLANKLRIDFYDKELINLASEKSGLRKELFDHADEKSSHSLLGGLLGLRNSMVDQTSFDYLLSNEALFKIQSDVIREIAKKQSAVFVGRCADYILMNEINCINIFVSADMDERIQRIADSYKITQDKSRLLIQKIDKQRSAYYTYYTSKDWSKAISYHVCLNSSFLGLENTTNLLYKIVVQKFFRD